MEEVEEVVTMVKMVVERMVVEEVVTMVVVVVERMVVHKYPEIVFVTPTQKTQDCTQYH